jgi:hypothetical protein
VRLVPAGYHRRSMSNPLTPFMGDALARVAPVLGGRVTAAGSWFDGFWDFVAENRDRLKREAAWEIQGTVGPPWAVEILAPDDPAGPLCEVYVFVENKDRRPGVSPPWPVSSLDLGGDGSPQPGERDRFDRPHDHALAERLRGFGFTPRVGYWGLRCETSVARDEPYGADRIGAILSRLPDVVALALRLADALPA